MFLLALPGGLLLAWGRVRSFAARWIPGAALVREGLPLRGYLFFGLFVFAVAPLLWLLTVRVPAPGIVSADGEGVPSSMLPPLPGGGESFLRLLGVYAGAELFWSLVLLALAASLGTQAYTRWRAGPGFSPRRELSRPA
jgi:hypothetical protein